MTDMPYDEEHLAELLGLLKPAPLGWVEAAAELPAARRALAEIGPRLLEGVQERAVQTAALEAALREAGYEPTAGLVTAVRRGLERRER